MREFKKTFGGLAERAIAPITAIVRYPARKDGTSAWCRITSAGCFSNFKFNTGRLQACTYYGPGRLCLRSDVVDDYEQVRLTNHAGMVEVKSRIVNNEVKKLSFSPGLSAVRMNHKFATKDLGTQVFLSPPKP